LDQIFVLSLYREIRESEFCWICRIGGGFNFSGNCHNKNSWIIPQIHDLKSQIYEFEHENFDDANHEFHAWIPNKGQRSQDLRQGVH